MLVTKKRIQIWILLLVQCTIVGGKCPKTCNCDQLHKVRIKRGEVRMSGLSIGVFNWTVSMIVTNNEFDKNRMAACLPKGSLPQCLSA